MQEYRCKKVTWDGLTEGDIVERWELEGGSTHYVSATVKDADQSAVTLLHWGVDEEMVPAENVLFYVRIPESVFHKQYERSASEIAKNIQMKIREEDAGYRLYHDGWFRTDPWALAACCEKEHLKVIGQFEIQDRQAYASWCDIGICFENIFEERFWCRANSADLRRALFTYYDNTTGHRC